MDGDRIGIGIQKNLGHLLLGPYSPFIYIRDQREGVNSAIVASMGFPFGYAMLLGGNQSGIGLHSYGSFTLTSNLIE